VGVPSHAAGHPHYIALLLTAQRQALGMAVWIKPAPCEAAEDWRSLTHYVAQRVSTSATIGVYFAQTGAKTDGSYGESELCS
jgi:hypothetical protein